MPTHTARQFRLQRAFDPHLNESELLARADDSFAKDTSGLAR